MNPEYFGKKVKIVQFLDLNIKINKLMVFRIMWRKGENNKNESQTTRTRISARVRSSRRRGKLKRSFLRWEKHPYSASVSHKSSSFTTPFLLNGKVFTLSVCNRLERHNFAFFVKHWKRIDGLTFQNFYFKTLKPSALASLFQFYVCSYGKTRR